jgi:hypothetical protein
LLQILGIDVNSSNKKTLWSCAHWLAYHNDIKSLTFLTEKGLYLTYPDAKGYLPIDIAGIMGNRETVAVIMRHILGEIKPLLIETQKSKDKPTPDPKLGEDCPLIVLPPAEDLNFLQEKLETDTFYARTLRGDYLWYRLLYWCCYYNFESYTKEILQFKPNVIPELALTGFEKNNCFHACCYKDNFNILNLLFRHCSDQKRQIFEGKLTLIVTDYHWNLRDNKFLNLYGSESEIYDQKFLES